MRRPAMIALCLVLSAGAGGCRPEVEPGETTPGADVAPAPDAEPPADVEPAASEVILRVEPAAAAAGDTVELVLANGSGEGVGYNLCTSRLERSADGAWAVVPSDRVCTMELRLLSPGQEARFPLDLPSDLAAGTYRVVTAIERGGAAALVDLASDPFPVE